MLYQIIALAELFIKHRPLRVFFLFLSRVCGDGSALSCLRQTINTDSGDVQNTQRYWTSTILSVTEGLSQHSQAAAQPRPLLTTVPLHSTNHSLPKQEDYQIFHREIRRTAVRSTWANILFVIFTDQVV